MFEKYGYAMLDGGLSTQLEHLGANMEGALWTSRVLMEEPGLLKTACRQFLEAGADVIATATYQASVDGFLQAGVSREKARNLMREAIRLAVAERDEFWGDTSKRAGRLRPLVAASLGPYGACLHDGSEYHGNYAVGLKELIDYHRGRIEVLADAGADIFAFETWPSLLEAQAIFELLPEFPEIRAWISFSCIDKKNVAHGESFAECAELAARQAQVVAVGVNCLPPENVLSLLKSAQGCPTGFLTASLGVAAVP